eukprot:TRINITY_DN13888_c0_g1_i1.p1 TRINITY_DN13888_c0_g1~~TRINITY_DN13888_c0_g1_i1.p1  ORF type:complete len:659 (+),score=151.53 TRINITY_DN13888_c0_g1_i1:93-2069(+)
MSGKGPSPLGALPIRGTLRDSSPTQHLSTGSASNMSRPGSFRRSVEMAAAAPFSTVGSPAGEAFNFPSRHDCVHCSRGLSQRELRYGTGLCDECYQMCQKVCQNCSKHLELKQLHWGTGLCNPCYDLQRAAQRRGYGSFASPVPTSSASPSPVSHSPTPTEQPTRPAALIPPSALQPDTLPAGVRAAIAAQFVFYLAPTSMLPALFLHIQRSSWGAEHATANYAAVLTTASVVGMVAPIPIGIWADYRSVRETYAVLTTAAAAAGVVLAFAQSPFVFTAAWAVLAAPPAVRGVRSAYFAKVVVPGQLSRAGMLSSAAGLTGGFCGPMVSTVALWLFGSSSNPSASDTSGFYFSGFTACALFASVVHVVCAMCLAATLPERTERVRDPCSPASPAEENRASVATGEYCTQHERAGIRKELEPREAGYALSLCDPCYEQYAGNLSFRRYRQLLLASSCAIALLLEFSANAAVLATFQPIAVSVFHWGEREIAAANAAGAALSIVISVGAAQLRLPERALACVSAGLYWLAVALMTVPPLTEWRAVLGLMIALKAQILFMAPFTAVFALLIGRMRVTTYLTTLLCLAPLIGCALGNASAPYFLTLAGTPAFMLAGLPASFAFAGLCLARCMGWMDEPPGAPVLRPNVGGLGAAGAARRGPA